MSNGIVNPGGNTWKDLYGSNIPNFTLCLVQNYPLAMGTWQGEVSKVVYNFKNFLTTCSTVQSTFD